jgi:hypothetical protein
MQLPQLLLPHWLILAGSVLALLGTIGLLLFPPKVSDEIQPGRKPKQRTTNDHWAKVETWFGQQWKEAEGCLIRPTG